MLYSFSQSLWYISQITMLCSLVFFLISQWHCTVICWQTNSKSVTVSSNQYPTWCVCFYCWNVYTLSAVLCIFIHRSHSLHLKTPTDRVHCYINNPTKHFVYFVFEQGHKDLSLWWHWYVHWHWLLRGILSKLRAFDGKPLCGAVWMNSFVKCTFWFCKSYGWFEKCTKVTEKLEYYIGKGYEKKIF